MFNDIWSLGIILLNLATGRNPWKSATADDPTFQAYLRDPYGFLPTVLPISAELNDILVQMLDVDWRQRMKLADIRYAIEELTSFYSDGVVFEGSMARCPWEAGMDIDSSSSEEQVEDAPPSPHISISSPVKENSRWSKDSTSDIIFAGRSSHDDDDNYGVPWPAEYSSCGATWAFESPVSSSSSGDEDPFPLDRCDSDTESEASTESPTPSLPATPNNFDVSFAAQQTKQSPLAGLTINTNLSRPRIYHANASMDRSFSTESDMMHTAIEYDPYSSLFYLSTPLSAKLIPDSALTAVADDKEMISPSLWRRSYIEMSSPSEYSSSLESFNDSDTRAHDHFARSASPSPEPHSSQWLSVQHGQAFAQVESPPSHQCQPSTPSSAYSPMTDISPSPPSRPLIFSSRKLLPRSAATVPIPSSPRPRPAQRADNCTTPTSRQPQQQPLYHQQQEQSQPAPAANRFSIKLFPRASPSSAAPAAPSAQVGGAARGRAELAKPYSTSGRRKTLVAQDGEAGAEGRVGRASGSGSSRTVTSRSGGSDGSVSSRCSSNSTASGSGSGGVVERVERRKVVGRRNATRHWFMPGKFFGAVGA